VSEPPQDRAAPPPEELHTEAELAELAAEMPTVPENLEVNEAAPSWPREVIDPDATDAASVVVQQSAAVQSASAGGIATAVRAAVPTSGIRDGGTVIRPSTGQSVRWTPIEPVADEYDAAKALAGQGFSCLGVIGDASHLLGSGGHTPWCSEGFAGKACKFGKVYAIDLEVPNMAGFERWFVAKMRANVYKWVYYFNINGHQYTRVDSYRGQYSSADFHLHISGLAGHENDNSTILRDWQAFRTTGGDDMASVPQAQWDRARKQLDALSDAVNGGAGEGYKTSVMRKDHGFQIDEIDRRVQAYVDQRISALESKLDALLAATGTTTGTTTTTSANGTTPPPQA
jgi:hypothetical protein